MNTESCKRGSFPLPACEAHVGPPSHHLHARRVRCATLQRAIQMAAARVPGGSFRRRHSVGKDEPSFVYSCPPGMRSFTHFQHSAAISVARNIHMRLSGPRHTDHEKDVFKALHAAGPNVHDGGQVILAKRAVLPRRMVKAEDHSVIGPLYRQLMGELDLAKRSTPLSRKKKVVPNSGHHGATPAGKETYAIGIPRTTEPKEAATRAPPHTSYFHEPAHQPTQTKMEGAVDLHKQAAAEQAAQTIKQLHEQPLTLEQMKKKWE
jgi:hypothetical protein